MGPHRFVAVVAAVLFGCAAPAAVRPDEPAAASPTDEKLAREIVASSTTEHEAAGVYFEGACPGLDGEIALRVRLVFEQPSTVYSWRGRLDPALGHILFVDVVRDGVPLEVSRASGPMPVFPHPDDTVTATEVTYAHPVRARLTGPDGPPPRGGTYRIDVRYDTTRADHPSYDRAGLSRVAVAGRVLVVCE